MLQDVDDHGGGPVPCSLRFITSVQGAASSSTRQMRKTLIPELTTDPTTALRQLERLKKNMDYVP